MCGQTTNNQISENAITEKMPLHMLEEQNGFAIAPCDTALDFEDRSRFAKLKMGSVQKMRISALMQQMPSVMASNALAQAYVVKFPQGLPHTLTALHQGGYGSMILQDGRFVGSASFYAMSTQAALLNAFSALSVVSGQYFLAQINSEIKMMNLKLDQILNFLYGDKKAELMAEMSFVRYAYENYASIMLHEQQRIATLASLQESKKIAMKDIEFYISELDATVCYKIKTYPELEEKIKKSFQMKESLTLSQQLYTMSGILETYFAQNQDKEYLDAVKESMTAYIKKCDSRMLVSFTTLKNNLDDYKARPMEKVDKSESEKCIEDVVNALHDGEESEMSRVIRSALHVAEDADEYYVTNRGDVYIKA